jgi:uncharacterized coiled-coil protein SlyX
MPAGDWVTINEREGRLEGYNHAEAIRSEKREAYITELQNLIDALDRKIERQERQIDLLLDKIDELKDE